MTKSRSVPVNVISSTRRKKTVSARWVGNAIEVRVPAGLPAAERDHHVRVLTKRLQRKRSAGDLDLAARARDLAKRFDLPAPSSIEWSARQQQRWGSCTPASGAVRISDRLSAFPQWVIDYVIVHELAHLVEANHSPEFHSLVGRFDKAERAEGFLLAVSLGHAGELSASPSSAPCTPQGTL